MVPLICASELSVVTDDIRKYTFVVPADAGTHNHQRF
jgi:hypothetical protein